MTEACFETLRIQGGAPQHLAYHTARLNRTRAAYYGIRDPLDLESYIYNVVPANDPLPQRLRIVYNASGILSYSLTLYTPRPITAITLVEADIDYRYKYADRTALAALLQAHPDTDEILITTDGFLRDTTIANIALRQDGIWYTPADPLLPGTTRARLLNTGQLHERPIHRNTLSDYDRLAIFNAMSGFVQYPLSLLTH